MFPCCLLLMWDPVTIFVSPLKSPGGLVQTWAMGLHSLELLSQMRPKFAFLASTVAAAGGKGTFEVKLSYTPFDHLTFWFELNKYMSEEEKRVWCSQAELCVRSYAKEGVVMELGNDNMSYPLTPGVCLSLSVGKSQSLDQCHMAGTFICATSSSPFLHSCGLLSISWSHSLNQTSSSSQTLSSESSTSGKPI